jgi:hypothetical protein
MEKGRQTRRRRRLRPLHYGGAGAGADPRNKIWDAFLARVTRTWPEKFPPSWDGLLWYLFILHNLEQLEIIGPLISTLLDTVTLSLPTLADMAEDILSKLLLLAPIPYAGLAGEMLGYAVAVVFSLIAAGLSTSRRRYGDAMKATLEVVPVMGDVLAQGAQSFEIGAERYELNRAKFLESLGRVSPNAAAYFAYRFPTIADAPPLPPAAAAWNSAAVQANVQKYIADKSGATAVLDRIDTLATNPVGALISQQGSSRRRRRRVTRKN